MATAAEESKQGTFVSEFKVLHPLIFFRRTRTFAFAYVFMFAFVAFTFFLIFTPSSNSAATPWFNSVYGGGGGRGGAGANMPAPRGSQFSFIVSYFFPNFSSPNQSTAAPPLRSRGVAAPVVRLNATDDARSGKAQLRFARTNRESSGAGNRTAPTAASSTRSPLARNGPAGSPVPRNAAAKNGTARSPAPKNETEKSAAGRQVSGKVGGKRVEEGRAGADFAAALKKQNNGTISAASAEHELLLEALVSCDLFDGEWVRDESYPLYAPGSCSLIDEQFDCFLNGRPDKHYQQLKWKPRACNIPRLDASRMLEMLRGKRLAFVGDSLNRNMWESLVCILRNVVKDKSKVYEASGQQYFRSEASYSFVFQDYNCSVEFFVTPFLVQEWEMVDKNGSKQETLRLDLVERSRDNYKDADFLIFNTGHWWTHEKTSAGKDYYQEGSHVYAELNVLEAFRKAVTTWGRWIDANINPWKTSVFFRGYSASHFSGGQWNSGGACDNETEPIQNKTYLTEYPPMMMTLERVLRGMNTHATYLNVTTLTDYRKDGHPSIYRKQNLTLEELRSPLRFQDCSHWCLPGVPDAWNELLYAELLINQHKRRKQQQKQKMS